jgi:hypothetical protein
MKYIKRNIKYTNPIEYMREYRKLPDVKQKRYEQWKRYKKTHPNVIKRMVRKRGLNSLCINGKRVKVIKRPFLGFCECCGNYFGTDRLLNWHHWDDTKSEYGLWICHKCHNLVECAEINNIEIPWYNKLKEIVECLDGLT